MNKTNKRFLLGIIGISLIFSLMAPLNSVCAQNNPFLFNAHVANADSNPVTLEQSDSYSKYLETYKNPKDASMVIPVDVTGYTSSDYMPETRDNYEQKIGKSLLTTEDGYVEWTVTVEQEGLYSILVDYYPVSGKGSSIGRSLQIDGKLPYEEARNIVFARTWCDETGTNGETIQKDKNGNDIRPSQVEKPVWMQEWVKDSVGYINEPLKFYFSKGTHTLRFTAVKEPMLLNGITLKSADSPLSYEEVQQQYKQNGYKAAQVEAQKIQGEETVSKSDPMIVPVSDRSRAATEPNNYAKVMLNAVGGTNWQQSGQWVTWEFTVPETGLYKIGVKSLQNTQNGAVSGRRVYIDGVTPFKELLSVNFKYSSDWQMTTLGGESAPYEFYLEAGKTHTLKMEATLGDIASQLKKVSEIAESLNSIYRKILVVTGPNPDVNRDYQFEDVMPDVMQDLKAESEQLLAAYRSFVDEAGMNGENAQLLKKIYMQTSEMAKKPDTIPKRFTAFQSNISALGTWIMTTKNQPLEIDYIMIAPISDELPSPKSGFINNLLFSAGSFISSFYTNYNTISDGDPEAIKVWVGNGLTGGRDQAQILKTMADNYFTVKSGIKVELQLVSMGSLLPSTLAGKGPDVALTIGQSEVLNYAFRNAVTNLAEFDDFADIKKEFAESAITPLSFGNGVYGLPETQTYPMLFYRKDILQELKLSVPNTWQDVVAMLPVLQKNQMNFGLPSAVGPIGASMSTFTTLLYQNGGELYNEDGVSSALNSRKSIEAFQFLTSLYNDYEIPIVIDFANRFRTGETPIGIADYSMYNQLSVFAPELEGIWGFTQIPGVLNDDGTIDRSVAGGVYAGIILSKSEKKQSAWEFLKWWTGTEAQVRFGKELESVMGTAARYPAANLEALKQIPWSKENFTELMAQRQWVKGIPEVPGGYYTSRYIDFAFRDVINKSYDAGETITKAAKTINKEIASKREEFGLN